MTSYSKCAECGLTDEGPASQCKCGATPRKKSAVRTARDVGRFYAINECLGVIFDELNSVCALIAVSKKNSHRHEVKNLQAQKDRLEIVYERLKLLKKKEQ